MKIEFGIILKITVIWVKKLFLWIYGFFFYFFYFAHIISVEWIEPIFIYKVELAKCIPKEISKIFSKFYLYIAIQTLWSIFFSGIIIFSSISKNEIYALSTNIGSVEFIKILILENISYVYDTYNKNLEFFSCSTIFSVYLLIWDILLFILEVSNVKNKSIIIFQFSFGIAVLFILIALSFKIYFYKGIANNTGQVNIMPNDTISNSSINCF